MGLKYNRRLVAGSALALLLALTGAARAEEKAAAEPPVAFDAMSVDTFAGAFLAARTADNDYDYATAISLYRTALKYDPANIEVRERLMICLFMNGDFNEGVSEAEKLKDDPAVERIATIARGIEAIRAKDYAKANTLLKYDGPNELDRMVNTLLMAWSLQSEGKTADAIKAIEKLEGPEWYGIFKNYSAGLIAASAGDVETARKKLSETIANRDEGASATDSYHACRLRARGRSRPGPETSKRHSTPSPSARSSRPATCRCSPSARQSRPAPSRNCRSSRYPKACPRCCFRSAPRSTSRFRTRPTAKAPQDIVAFYLVTSYALAPTADAAVLLGGLAEGIDKPEKAIEWYKRVPADSAAAAAVSRASARPQPRQHRQDRGSSRASDGGDQGGTQRHQRLPCLWQPALRPEAV